MTLRSRTLRFALSGVLATVMLTGCAGSNKMAQASSRAEKSHAKADRAVAHAEKAVAASPRDAALRSALGQAYLDAGRFDSAASAFNDALTLGDASGSTALRLALAETGAGNQAEALAVLGQHRDVIAASDLGLALALAGETRRGVEVLSDALRGGDNTVKTRQNLAYAYALDGRWREARVMAAQDVPADQLDARISDWALQGRPEAWQQRVASLLNVEARPDAGQPEQLALGEPTEQQAAAAPAPVTPVVAAVTTELPALAETPVAAPVEAPVAVAQNTPAPEPVIAPKAAQSFAAAFDAPPQASQPVTQPLPLRPFSAPRVAAKAQIAFAPAKNGTHFVQLGSFSSEKAARWAQTALAKRNPELRNARMVITPAVVRGKNYWRVAVAGYSAASAQRACASVRVRGGACFAYAATRAPAGARPTAAPALASAWPVNGRNP